MIIYNFFTYFNTLVLCSYIKVLKSTEKNVAIGNMMLSIPMDLFGFPYLWGDKLLHRQVMLQFVQMDIPLISLVSVV